MLRSTDSEGPLLPSPPEDQLLLDCSQHCCCWTLQTVKISTQHSAASFTSNSTLQLVGESKVKWTTAFLTVNSVQCSLKAHAKAKAKLRVGLLSMSLRGQKLRAGFSCFVTQTRR